MFLNLKLKKTLFHCSNSEIIFPKPTRVSGSFSTRTPSVSTASPLSLADPLRSVAVSTISWFNSLSEFNRRNSNLSVPFCSSSGASLNRGGTSSSPLRRAPTGSKRFGIVKSVRRRRRCVVDSSSFGIPQVSRGKVDAESDP